MVAGAAELHLGAGFALPHETLTETSMKQALLLAVLLVAHGASLAAEPAAKPNVLFIFMDDQQADTIAALGNKHIQTPNLDRLVKRGVAFDRAYMQGGMNGATCVPSRAMLLSGRPLFRIDEKLLRDETWPAAFGKAGYSTYISGKWHNGPPSIAKSFQEARSIFAGGMTNPLKAKLSHVVDGKLAPPEPSEKHICSVFADEAIAILKKPHTKPFFSYVAFDGPHDPHIVPDDFAIKYDPNTIPLPPNFLPQHTFNNGEMAIRDETLLAWPRPPEKVREMIAEYYRYISYLDHEIGRILAALEASPYAKNTIVVFAADSGVARGQHGLIGKQNVYEHSMRVPLVIAGPGIPEDKRTNAMCYLFDVLPTLGKLCGVPGPSTSEGVDFSASLRDPSRAVRSQMVFAYQKVQRAIRDDRWKLIRYPQINKTQLFDLKTDPWEMTNLAEKPEHAEHLTDLTDRMAKELTQFGDTAKLTSEKPLPAEWSPPKKK
jgi:arylsulfatase A-like enzyme